MDQGPKDGGLGAQASFDSLNGDSDDDAFSEVTGISRRSMSGWGSFAGLQGAERNVSRFFRRFIPSHTTAQTGVMPSLLPHWCVAWLPLRTDLVMHPCTLGQMQLRLGLLHTVEAFGHVAY